MKNVEANLRVRPHESDLCITYRFRNIVVLSASEGPYRKILRYAQSDKQGLLSEVFFTSDSYQDVGVKHQHPAEQKGSSLRSERQILTTMGFSTSCYGASAHADVVNVASDPFDTPLEFDALTLK